MGKRLDFTTPIGRMVGGNIYTPETTDYYGKPLLGKDNQPRVDYQLAVAFPKTPGVTHWSQEPWGKAIYAHAYTEFKQNEPQRPDFSWKIVDGDSTIPNKKNRKPCDREGYPGHWVIWFSGGYAPTVYNENGSAVIVEKDAVVPGDYVQVFGNTQGNDNLENPGMYFNHTYVALSKKWTRIVMGPDVAAAGFGQGVTLPANVAGAAPGNFNPAPQAGAAGLPPPPPVNAAPPPPAQTAVAPNHEILNQVPPPPPVNAAPPPPPTPPVASTEPQVPAGRQLTTKAAGQTYASLLGAGWTDDLLLQHGYMV